MDEFAKFSAALRALADASDNAIARMRAAKIKDAETTNYPTAVRGFGYVINFVSGIAGTATTAEVRHQLEPILQELEKLEELKKQAKQSSGKAKVGRPKKSG